MIHRCTSSVMWARLRAWWPDVYMALILAVAMLLALFGPSRVLEATGLGKIVPHEVAMAWAALLLVLSLWTIAAVVTRRYDVASWTMLGLCIAVGANGAVTTAANGWGAITAAAMYGIVAVSFFDRSRILRAPVPMPPGWKDRT